MAVGVRILILLTTFCSPLNRLTLKSTIRLNITRILQIFKEFKELLRFFINSGLLGG